MSSTASSLRPKRSCSFGGKSPNYPKYTESLYSGLDTPLEIGGQGGGNEGGLQEVEILEETLEKVSLLRDVVQQIASNAGK